MRGSAELCEVDRRKTGVFLLGEQSREKSRDVEGAKPP
jgi:hypothetical protein